MKKKLLILVMLFALIGGLSKTYAQCTNADFSAGNFTNWTGSIGENIGGNYTSYTVMSAGLVVGTPNQSPYAAGQQTIMNVVGTDPNTGNLLNVLPPNGANSCMLGNAQVEACDGSSYPQAARLEYTITIDSSNSIFNYQYAVVLQNPNHTPQEQPKFIVRVLSAAGVELDSSIFIAGGNLSGFQSSLPSASACESDSVEWKNWSTANFNLLSYIGQTVTIEFTTYDCTPGSHFCYAYISCYCGTTDCLANFVYTDTLNTVKFVSTSSGSINSWLWTFGDSTHSTLQNPFHTYASNGTYSVCLTASDTANSSVVCSNTYCANVVVGNQSTTGTAYITNVGNNTVSVVNIATGTIIDTIAVGSYPVFAALSPDGSKVYVSNNYDNTVSVINTATNTVSSTIAVGNQPYGLCVSPDNSKVYVADWGTSTVSVISTSTNTVTATISGFNGAYDVSISPDGSKVYVTNYYSGNTVSVINTATNAISGTITVGTGPVCLAVSPDGSKVYVANGNHNAGNTVSVISTAADTTMATITVGSDPVCVSVSPDGSKVYVTNYFSNSVSVINAATNTVSATVKVGANPFALSVSSDGSQIYVVNHISNSTSVINAATNTVSDSITGFSSPYGIANLYSPNSAPCQANFNYYADTAHANLIDFYGYSIGNINSWLWSFGDTTTSTLQNPSHTYAVNGQYDVCLTASDTANGNVVCSNTYCNWVNVSSYPDSLFSIYGKVTAGGASTVAAVILFNTDYNYYNAVNYYITNDTTGAFIFNNVRQGHYILWAIPDTTIMPVYLPTYFGDVLYWQNAYILYVNANTYNVDIHLVPLDSASGHQKVKGNDGNISGTVVFDNNLTYETNIFGQSWFSGKGKGSANTIAGKNIPVYLKNTNGDILNWKLAKDNGDFAFSNIALQDYTVNAEKASLQSISPVISLTSANPIVNNVIINIGTKNIVTSVKEITYNVLNSLSYYPNPVKDNLNLVFNLNKEAMVDISIFNLTGQEIMKTSYSMPEGSNTLTLNMSGLSSGMYFVRVNANKSNAANFKVIK